MRRAAAAAAVVSAARAAGEKTSVGYHTDACGRRYAAVINDANLAPSVRPLYYYAVNGQPYAQDYASPTWPFAVAHPGELGGYTNTIPGGYTTSSALAPGVIMIGGYPAYRYAPDTSPTPTGVSAYWPLIAADGSLISSYACTPPLVPPPPMPPTAAPVSTPPDVSPSPPSP